MIKHLLALSLCTLVATSSFADKPANRGASADHSQRSQMQQRHQGERAAKRERNQSGVVSRTSERQKTDNGFIQTTTKTNADGQTASRETTLVRDAETKTISKSTTGTNFNGDSYSQTSVKQKTDTGFTKTNSVTNAAGATATREVTLVRDPETKTATKTISGTNFNGDAYSATDVKQKTDTGFTRESERTNAQGETISRSVVTTIDKDAGSIDKVISKIDKDGNTHTTEISKTKTQP